tara:strand:- start:3892 stop:4374 length:483 start_codon:yes stop_codon:yes gene_type:complete
MNIAKTSPLYDYWNSDQGEDAENIRLSKLNINGMASNLFRNEPYKWENLYQSVVRNLISGDDSSIKALLVLLSSITKKEKEIVLCALENFLSKDMMHKLRYENHEVLKSSKNILNAFKILLNIFINPYGLEIKKNKKHIYEKTGMMFYQLRKLILFKSET